MYLIKIINEGVLDSGHPLELYHNHYLTRGLSPRVRVVSEKTGPSSAVRPYPLQFPQCHLRLERIMLNQTFLGWKQTVPITQLFT